MRKPSALQTSRLSDAGLGDRIGQLSEDADMVDIANALATEYPQLGDAGGYDFLKAERSGPLTLIQQRTQGFSVPFFKQV